MTTVAFIGLGAMGAPMASNLIDAGFALRVYNRNPGKAAALAEKGAIVWGSPAEAVQGVQFVVSMVADDNATREVMLGANGVMSVAAAGTII
ncbi:MAG: NAD(P)-binding domain-containing protein, partial [Quisquiliibacterium sp.]